MGIIIIILYLALGYWAVGKVLYENKVLIGTAGNIFMKKITIAFVFGWILIPVAIIKSIIFK